MRVLITIALLSIVLSGSAQQKKESDTVTVQLTSLQQQKLLEADQLKSKAEDQMQSLLEFIFDANGVDKSKVQNFGYQPGEKDKPGKLIILYRKEDDKKPPGKKN